MKTNVCRSHADELPGYLLNAEFVSGIDGSPAFREPFPDSSKVFDWAVFYVSQGWSVFPLRAKGKRPVCEWREYQTRLPTMAELKKWFPPGTTRNIAVVTGSISRINVIDCDNAETYQKVMEVEPVFSPLVRTARGYHLYCRATQGASNFQKHPELEKMDFRGEGGYVVAPPSIHPSGSQYEWVQGSGYVALPDLPSWLQAKRKEKPPTRELLPGVPEGGRNNALARLAGRWFSQGKGLDEVHALAEEWNSHNMPPMDKEEVMRTVKSIHRLHEDGENPPRKRVDEPMPLRRPTPEAAEFPLDALPSVLGDATGLVIETLQVPPALAAQSALAASALAVQGFANVIIDGRTYPLSNFFLSIAESGERKSAVDRLFLAPHHERQRSLAALAVSQRADFNIQHAAWKHRRDSLVKKKAPIDFSALSREIGKEPLPPLDPLFIVEEPTYEGLIKLLETGQPSVGLFSDEGGRFIGGHGMNKDNMLKTIAGLSKIWDGDQITRSRSGDGHNVLYNRRCSMHLMIQPQIMPSLFGQGLLAGQGFLSRVLCAYPASTIGTRRYRDSDIRSAPAFKRYCETLGALLNTPLPVNPDEPAMGLQLSSLVVTREAKEVWTKFHDKVESSLKDGQAYAPIKGLAAKAAEHALRIAAVLSLIEEPHTKTVSAKTMADAARLMEYYLTEALRLFGHGGENPDLKLAEDCLAWGKRQGGYIELTKLYQYGPNQLRNKAEALRIISILIDHGWLEKIDGGMVINERRHENVWRIIDPAPMLSC